MVLDGQTISASGQEATIFRKDRGESATTWLQLTSAENYHSIRSTVFTIWFNLHISWHSVAVAKYDFQTRMA
jgi:hypothetical protein